MSNVELVVIDPQNSFCKNVPAADQQTLHDGELCVPGAAADMDRLAIFVKKWGRKLSDISITLDSHHPVDVAHPCFWRDSFGKNPSPFTIISAADVTSGKWLPSIPSKELKQRVLQYVTDLENGKRYPLCIWPPHCLIGSPGHNVYASLFDALYQWEVSNFMTLTTVTKGSNPYTEHYSAVKAEVPDPTDPTTQINTGFIEKLKKCDLILASGEALNFCLANTFQDIADAFGDDSYVKKLVLLRDATSSVPGFQALEDNFLKNMTARGMQMTTTIDFSM